LAVDFATALSTAKGCIGRYSQGWR
jgi:hypothetical protein